MTTAGDGRLAPRTVEDSARDRVRRVLDDFDNVIVAFSGGKDSGAVLNLVLEELRDRPRAAPVHVFHLDYEVQYSATSAYVDKELSSHGNRVRPWRICLPVTVPSSTTAFDDHWKPWDPSAAERWVRDLPAHPGVVHRGNVPSGFPAFDGVRDYAFQDDFARWHHSAQHARRTAVLIGNREEESLQRYAAIHRADKHAMFEGLRWTSLLSPQVVKAYPIHDWTLSDVWHAHAARGWSYNRLYDLLHHAGVPTRAMRVSSPFIGQAIHELRLYRVIEPQLWARVVGRVTGADFAALHGGSRAMAARDITLPDGHTWHSYLLFLLDTLPERTRARYQATFATSVRYWTDTGGALPIEVVTQLLDQGVGIELLGPPRTARRYSRPHEVVRFLRYPDDLPGVRPARVLPTYRRMCLAILRNDHTCRTLGFGPTRHERQRRQALTRAFEGARP